MQPQPQADNFPTSYPAWEVQLPASGLNLGIRGNSTAEMIP